MVWPCLFYEVLVSLVNKAVDYYKKRKYEGVSGTMALISFLVGEKRGSKPMPPTPSAPIISSSNGPSPFATSDGGIWRGRHYIQKMAIHCCHAMLTIQYRLFSLEVSFPSFWHFGIS
jgi:hypothetical protein